MEKINSLIKTDNKGIRFVYSYKTRKELISTLSRDILDEISSSSDKDALYAKIKELLSENHIPAPALTDKSKSPMQRTLAYLDFVKLWDTMRNNNLLEKFLQKINNNEITNIRVDNLYTSDDSHSVYHYHNHNLQDMFVEWITIPAI